MYNLTREQLEEIITAIVTNHFDESQAMEYALSVCGEHTFVNEIVWPDESRIDIIGTNGNDGLYYGKAVEAGVYDS